MCYSKQLVLNWATLQNLAEENFGRGRAILARVPTEKASECEKWPYGPIEAVGNCGDVFLCSKSCEWVQIFTHGGLNTAPPVCLSSSAELFSLLRDCGTKTLLPALYFFVCLCWRKYPQTGSSASFFGLPSSPSCRRKRVVFSTPGRAFFHSETPDRALLAYLLQDILSHLPAFLVVLAILIRLGIFVRQWDSRRFVFLFCTKGFCFNDEYPDFFIFWLAQTTFSEYIQRSSSTKNISFEFSSIVSSCFVAYTASGLPSPLSETTLGRNIASLCPRMFRDLSVRS